MKNAIGRNIRNLRLKGDISQDRLSKLADLSLNTIVKIEAGKNANPTIDTLSRIAGVFKVKVDDLIRICILVLFLAGYFQAAYAEEVSPPAQQKSRLITISEGIRILLKESRLIKISSYDNEISYQDSLVARSVLLPKINAFATETFLRFQPASKFGAQTVNTADRQSFSYGIYVYQTLFDFGKSILGWRSANESTQARRVNTDSVKRLAELEFITAYFNLLETEKMIVVFEKETESLEAYLKDVEHLYGQGLAVESDLLPAKVKLADTRQKLISARNGRQLAVAALNNILALPLGENTTIVDIGMTQPDFPQIDEAWKTAEVQRTELVFYAEQIKASQSSARAKALENLPELFVNGGYAYSQNEYVAHEDNLSVAIGAKMDFYDGGTARALLLKERARQGQLETRKDKLMEDIKLEIEDSYYALKNASEKVLVARTALDEARENTRAYRLKYAAGSATPTEVLEAIALETAAQTNYYNDDYELKRSYAKLMYSMGIDLALIYERMESVQNGPAK